MLLYQQAKRSRFEPVDSASYKVYILYIVGTF